MSIRLGEIQASERDMLEMELQQRMQQAQQILQNRQILYQSLLPSNTDVQAELEARSEANLRRAASAIVADTEAYLCVRWMHQIEQTNTFVSCPSQPNLRLFYYLLHKSCVLRRGGWKIELQNRTLALLNSPSSSLSHAAAQDFDEQLSIMIAEQHALVENQEQEVSKLRVGFECIACKLNGVC
jgi:hypothetical protein